MNLLKNKISIYFGLALLLSSCVVGKKYSRTNTDIPQSYREPVPVTADTLLLPWRTFFKDPLLIGLIEKALHKNNEVSIAMMNMEQLDLRYKQAKLGLLPTLDMSVGANRNWLSKNSLNGSLSEQFLGTSYMDDYSATLRLTWEADIWGKAKMQKEGARANYFSQKENLSALKTRIIVQVAQAYYNLITLDEQLTVAKRNIALGDSTLSMIRLQFQSGQINSLAVEQAEAQQKTAELLVPLALQNIAVQENALSILCGSYPDSVARTHSLASVMPEEVFPSGVPALLLSRRPDVKAAEYAVVALNAQTGLAKAAMYPAISLTPSIGTNSFKFNTWFDLPGSLVKNIGANLTQPVFQQRSLKTAYEVAQIEQEKSVVQFKQSVLTAVGEVSDAMAKSRYASERMLLVEQKTASLTKSVKDAMLLFRSGMATYLEVITAQNNALQNELEAVNIRKDKLNAVTDLYRALGGGVE
jgi:NodT family efflux transporter outer membrane factor (OMF) lipoprotein